MSKTIHKGDNVIKNIECLFFFGFAFQAKLFGQEMLGLRQPNLI